MKSSPCIRRTPTFKVILGAKRCVLFAGNYGRSVLWFVLVELDVHEAGAVDLDDFILNAQAPVPVDAASRLYPLND